MEGACLVGTSTFIAQTLRQLPVIWHKWCLLAESEQSSVTGLQVGTNGAYLPECERSSVAGLQALAELRGCTPHAVQACFLVMNGFKLVQQPLLEVVFDVMCCTCKAVKIKKKKIATA